LACADGRSNLAVAAALGIDRKTVTKWRNRFLSYGLDGLHDQPRPGAPRTITDDDVEAVIVRTMAQTPDGVSHWSTRSMAHATGMSQSTISRIWRSFGLKPHLANRFACSPEATRNQAQLAAR